MPTLPTNDPTSLGVSDFIEFVNIVEDALRDAITEEFNNFIENSNTPLTGVNLELAKRLDELAESNASFTTKILGGLDDIARNIASNERAIFETIEEEISQFVTPISDTLGDVNDKILLAIELINSQENVTLEELNEKVFAGVDVLTLELEDTERGLTNKITSGIGSVFGAVQDASNFIFNKVETTASDIGESVSGALTGLPALFGSALSAVFGVILSPLGVVANFIKRDTVQKILDESEDDANILFEDEDTARIARKYGITGPIELIPAAVGILIGIVIAFPIQLGMTLFAGVTEKAKQLSFKKFRPTIFGAADMTELIRRKILTGEQARDILAKGGWTDEDTVRILSLEPQLLNLSEIISLWRRDIIDTEEFDRRLGELGIIFADQEHVKKLAFQIPPLQDLITFAVREAFQLDVAERFGQLFGLPSEIRAAFEENLSAFGAGVDGSVGAFAEFAKQSGIAPEWIAAYWAAHWREPGITQIFDIVHRLAPDIVASKRDDFAAIGLDTEKLAFTLEDLNTALQKQDITPFWWDKLTAIAFKPITRVDIRRFHKLGIIDDEELVRRYREVGFSPADAKLMGDFTIAFNEEPPEDEEDETKELTRNQVLEFFESGQFSEQEAIDLLVEIGHTQDAAETFVSLREVAILKSQRTTAIKTVEIRFDNGIIDFNTAVTELDALNVPPAERDLILAKLEAEVLNRIKVPSRANLDKLFKKGVIDEEIYRDTMLNQGWEPVWIDRFIQLLGIIAAEDDGEDLVSDLGLEEA